MNSQTSIDQFYTPKRARSNTTPEYGGNSGDMSPEVGKMKQNDLVNLMKEVFTTLLDTKLENMATKNDLSELKNEITKVSRKEEILENELKKMQSKHYALQKQTRDMENRYRRKNLLVFGIPTKLGENVKESLYELFKKTLQIEKEINIVRVFRIGKQKETIFLETLSEDDASVILSNSYRLKGTKIRINRDFCETTRAIRKKLFQIKKHVTSSKSDVKVAVKNDVLEALDKKFTWDTEKGLVEVNAVEENSINLNKFFQCKDIETMIEKLVNSN